MLIKNKKPVALAVLVVIAWFMITAVFGPLFGKLSSVQENNNSNFLPKGSEAAQASDAIAKFSDGKAFNFPTLVLFEGAATPGAIAALIANEIPGSTLVQWNDLGHFGPMQDPQRFAQLITQVDEATK